MQVWIHAWHHELFSLSMHKSEHARLQGICIQRWNEYLSPRYDPLRGILSESVAPPVT
jgi:hypothetical protein